MEGDCRRTAQSPSSITDSAPALGWDKINLGFFPAPCYLGAGNTSPSLHPPSVSHNLKSSSTDGQLGTITQHLPFACFVHCTSQDKDFSPHMRNPVIYKFNSSTYRKSQFHGLCLGASPRALPRFQVQRRAFTEGSIFQKGNPNCPNEHHLHFTARPAKAQEKWVHLLSHRGFPRQGWERSCLHFSTVKVTPQCHPIQEKHRHALDIQGQTLAPCPRTCYSREGLKRYATAGVRVPNSHTSHGLCLSCNVRCKWVTVTNALDKA